MKIKPDSVGNTEEGISLGKIIIIIIITQFGYLGVGVVVLLCFKDIQDGDE